MKPTIKQFRTFVDKQEDLNIKWYGRYNGRFCHDGIAIKGSLMDGGRLVERMPNNKIALGAWPHQDNLAFDYIMSWGVHLFANEEQAGDEGMKITCARVLADVEMEDLIAEAKMMDALGMNKTWVGDGMLYRTTGKDKFHFEDVRTVPTDALRKG